MTNYSSEKCRPVCEKYLGRGKEVLWTLMDLEKAYDRVDREALWNVLQMHGIVEGLLRAIKSFYKNSSA